MFVLYVTRSMILVIAPFLSLDKPLSKVLPEQDVHGRSCDRACYWPRQGAVGTYYVAGNEKGGLRLPLSTTIIYLLRSPN